MSLKSLLPPGKLFEIEYSSNLYKLLNSLFSPLKNFKDWLKNIAKIEVNPSTTTELITEWERLIGLDNCFDSGGATLQERRDYLASVLNYSGGQIENSYIGLASSLGYTITVESFPVPYAGEELGTIGMDICSPKEVTVNDTIGLPIIYYEWQYYLYIYVDALAPIHYLEIGSDVGLPIATYGIIILECRLNKIKPAFCKLLFIYNGFE